MSPSSVYGMVYRQNTPAGWKGRRCRVIALNPQRRDWLGKGEIYTGEALIGVEFDNGEKQTVPRQSIVPLKSRLGWAAVRNASKPPKSHLTKSEAKLAYYAKLRSTAPRKES